MVAGADSVPTEARGKPGSGQLRYDLSALNGGLIEILLAVKTPNETAEAVRNGMIRMFSKIPAEKIRNITPDRGHEFAKYAEVNDALHGVPFCFADPHSPWQRGNKLHLT